MRMRGRCCRRRRGSRRRFVGVNRNGNGEQWRLCRARRVACERLRWMTGLLSLPGPASTEKYDDQQSNGIAGFLTHAPALPYSLKTTYHFTLASCTAPPALARDLRREPACRARVGPHLRGQGGLYSDFYLIKSIVLRSVSRSSHRPNSTK